MTDGQSRFAPLVVAGVAGGVGTSTWVRLWQVAHGPAHDITMINAGHYTNGRVDVLITSNTAASTSKIGSTLNTLFRMAAAGEYQQPSPVLVVMHTVPGSVATLKAALTTVEPHITTTLHVHHKPQWLAMPEAPGDTIPRHKDIAAAFSGLARAITKIYAGSVVSAPVLAQPAAPQPVPVLPWQHQQFPARPLGSGPPRAHAAIRAGPWPPHAPVNGAHHNAMPRSRPG